MKCANCKEEIWQPEGSWVHRIGGRERCHTLVATPEPAAAPVPQLSVDAMAAKMAEYDENWTVSYGRGTKLWTIVIPWHDIKVHSKKLTETFELAEAALAQAREKGVK